MRAGGKTRFLSRGELNIIVGGKTRYESRSEAIKGSRLAILVGEYFGGNLT